MEYERPDLTIWPFAYPGHRKSKSLASPIAMNQEQRSFHQHFPAPVGFLLARSLFSSLFWLLAAAVWFAMGVGMFSERGQAPYALLMMAAPFLLVGAVWFSNFTRIRARWYLQFAEKMQRISTGGFPEWLSNDLYLLSGQQRVMFVLTADKQIRASGGWLPETEWISLLADARLVGK